MYRVPPSHTLDLRLRRAIAVAVVLCSLGSGLLTSLLADTRINYNVLIGIGTYLVLIQLCYRSVAKGSIRRWHMLAALGLTLTIACIAVRLVPAFHFTPESPWRWSKLGFSAFLVLLSPVYIRRYWNQARTAA